MSFRRGATWFPFFFGNRFSETPTNAVRKNAELFSPEQKKWNEVARTPFPKLVCLKDVSYVDQKVTAVAFQRDERTLLDEVITILK